MGSRGVVLERAFLHATVFLSGAAVMAIELLGPRVVAVYFGLTTYTWTALIGVALLGLSVGYVLGGNLADRRRPTPILYGAILVAAVSTALILLTREPILDWTKPLGVRWGALASALLLFAPGFLALGTVTPLAIRALTVDAASLGRGAGRVFGVSTVGSFLGTILSGFYLIPSLGVRTAILVLAASLAGVVLVWAVLFGRSWTLGAPAALFLAVLATQLDEVRRPPGDLSQGRILYQTDSMYGQVKVYERYPLRQLYVDNGVQTHWNYAKGRTQSAYVHFLRALLLCRPQARTLLNVGLGGGNVARLFHREHGLEVDVVEIDPVIVDVAHRYFDLGEGTIRELFVEDGRTYLARSERTYDLLVVDAYIGGTHPWQLLTLEAFRLMARNLSPGGVLAFSIPGSTRGPMSRIPCAVLRTLDEVFRHRRVFTQSKQKDESLFLIFASDRPIDFAGRADDLTDDSLARLYLERLTGELEITDTLEISGSPVLTDDDSPVSRWEWRSIEKWREEILEKAAVPDLYLTW